MWSWGIVAAAALGLLYMVGRARGARSGIGVLKPIPIVLLAVLVASEPAPIAEGYRWLVLAALVCSMAGDVWLLFPDRFFVAGLASFLLAHLLYIGAFVPGGGWDVRAWALLAPFALTGLGMLTALWPHLGGDRGPVMLYVAAIVVMGWRAAARAAAPVSAPSGIVALAGAVLFMISDGLLAVDRFARRSRAADTAVMGTYYTAQTLLALSVRG